MIWTDVPYYVAGEILLALVGTPGLKHMGGKDTISASW